MGNHVLPLANFGSATFTNCTAVMGGTRGSISDPRWTRIVFTIHTKGGARATTGGLTVGGTSFTVRWGHT